MSAHSCNNLCSNSLLHFAQKVLGANDSYELREICKAILRALDN